MARRSTGRRSAGGRVAPKWLEHKVARQLWTLLHDDLASMRFLQQTDQAALGRYCQYMAEWIELTKLLNAEGFTFTTSSEHVQDMVRIRPEVRIRKDAEGSMKALEDSLGLNPRYRFAITQALLGQSVPPKQGELPIEGDLPAGAPELADARTEWDRILQGGGKAN